MAFVSVAQHRFAEALQLAEQATATDPGEPAAYAVQGDALLALGRYPAAREAYARLHALAPSLASFARLAELAEVTGDIESATIAWRNALSFSQSRPDDRIWALVGFADFRFAIGDLDGASQLYLEALDAQPNYLQAFAGSARIAAANGDFDAAIERYETVVRRLPTPEHVLALADLYQATGRAEAAAEQRALVFAIADLYAANGIALDLTMALFLADYGDPGEAVNAGRERLRRPSERSRCRCARVGAFSGRPPRGSRRLQRRGFALRHARRALPLSRRRDSPPTRPAQRGPDAAGRGSGSEPALLGDRGRARPVHHRSDRRRAGGCAMSAVCGSARWLSLAAVVALVVLGLGAMRPQAARAHPLGNFTVNVFAGIDLHADVIRIHYAVDMAEIPAFQEIQTIDTDGDGTISEIEADRYFEERAPALIGGLSLIVDEREENLDLLDRALVLTPGEAGLRTLRIDLVLQTAAPLGLAEVAFSDGNYADRLGLREIVVRPGEGVPLLSSTAPAVSATDELRVYGDAAAATTPASAREARFTFEGGVGADAPAVIAIAPTGAERETGGGFASLLNRDTITFPVVLVMLLVALGFGAVHALEPGHGKTIVAAYLVGARGTALHSAALGLIVAVTHSLGVLAIGALTLYGSQYILPEDLYPGSPSPRACSSSRSASPCWRAACADGAGSAGSSQATGAPTITGTITHTTTIIRTRTPKPMRARFARPCPGARSSPSASSTASYRRPRPWWCSSPRSRWTVSCSGCC